MNAVNLIPVEDRRGAGAPGRSGGAVYAVLGALGFVVVLFALVTITGKQVKDKQNEVAAVTAQAQQAEAQAGSLEAYTQFASLRDKRQQTVASLASSRFDWAHALHELARVLPKGTVVTSVRGSVSPTVTIDGGTTDPLRGSLSVPAFELVGCAPSQDAVAQLLAALRRMDGVQRVSLSSSERQEPKAMAATAPGAASAGAGGGAGNGGSDCRGSSLKIPQFSLTIFFSAPQAAAAPTAGTTATTAPASTTAPATTTTTTGGTK